MAWTSRAWSSHDDLLTAEWRQRNGISVNTATAAQAVEAVARDRAFHPVHNYLSSTRLTTRRWSGVAGAKIEMSDNPMHRCNAAPRCRAKSKRTGLPCQSPAVKGYCVCRMQSARGGAPEGKRNGNFRHGGRTKDATDASRQRACPSRSRSRLNHDSRLCN